MRRETATVADYLGAVSLLLDQSAKVRVPAGLEQLRREIDARSSEARRSESLTWLRHELARYKADEVLTERSAAAVGEAVADHLEPVRTKFDQLINDKAYLKKCYTEGAEKAKLISSRVVSKVYHKVGFVDPR